MRHELPSTYNEIQDQRGFPMPEEELALLKNFLRRARQPALKLLKRQVPEWQPTENQFQLYLATLYGIYFYNLVAGGAILAGLTTRNKMADDYRRHYLKQVPPTRENLPLPALDLSRWPVHLLPEKGNFGAWLHGIIEIPVLSFPDTDPYDIRNIVLVSADRIAWHRFSQKLIRPWRQPDPQPLLRLPFYPNSLFYKYLLTGLQEAQHTHLRYLERIHYGAKLPQNDPRGPLKDLGSKIILELTHAFNDQGLIEYTALLGTEFAAHIVTGEYVHRYLPVVWQNGYQDYHQAVIDCRRRAKAI